MPKKGRDKQRLTGRKRKRNSGAGVQQAETAVDAVVAPLARDAGAEKQVGEERSAGEDSDELNFEELDLAFTGTDGTLSGSDEEEDSYAGVGAGSGDEVDEEGNGEEEYTEEQKSDERRLWAQLDGHVKRSVADKEGEERARGEARKLPVGLVSMLDDADSSEEEAVVDTVGDIPMEWYDEFDHIGYDLDGEPIMRPSAKDHIDQFLDREDGSHWRRVWDEKNHKEVLLSKEQMDVLRRIQDGKFVDPDYDPFPDMFETPGDTIHPLLNTPEPKRRFVPSKWEAQKVAYLVKALRKGWIKMEPEPEYDEVDQLLQKNFAAMWDDDNQVIDPETTRAARKRLERHISAPRRKLPQHDESYRPPGEYLLSEQGKQQWHNTKPIDRWRKFLPERHDSLGTVGKYEKLVEEYFERCLDLYMAPRAIQIRRRVDKPEDLLPKLPSPEELRPFPSRLSMAFIGHRDNKYVRTISPSPTGEFLASGCDDGTVRIWEVATGRCLASYFLAAKPTKEFIGELEELGMEHENYPEQVDSDDEPSDEEERIKFEMRKKMHKTERVVIHSIAWNPNPFIPLVLVAIGRRVGVLCVAGAIGHEDSPLVPQLRSVLNMSKTEEDSEQLDAEGNIRKPIVEWEGSIYDGLSSDEEDEDFVALKLVDGVKIWIHHALPVEQVTWHRKGDYFASVSPTSVNRSVIIHKLSAKTSQCPLKKKRKKGKSAVQCVEFHPSKPIFFVVSKRYVRVFHLQKQYLIKTLKPNAREASSISVHPSGDHLIVGTLDRRVCWFDLDYSRRPYRTLRYHRHNVRAVHIHPRYPLFASSSDDGRVHVFHGMVYNDFLKDALIVPLKILSDHKITNGIGVMDIKFHPTQPWLFTAGGDGRILMYT